MTQNLLSPEDYFPLFDHRRVRYTDYMRWVMTQIRPGQAPIDHVSSFDYETFLIQPAATAPKLVCASTKICTYGTENAPTLHHANFEREAIEGTIEWTLKNPSTLSTGANISFDLVVTANEFPRLLPTIFDALDQNRVVCVELAQRLTDIATNQLDGKPLMDGSWIPHKYNLAALAKRHLGIDMDKDTWRLRYGTLWGVPTHAWDPGARHYSMGDAISAGGVLQAIVDPHSIGAADSNVRRFMAQDERVGAELSLIDIFRQTRAQFWLALMVARGIRVDPYMVRVVKELLSRELDQVIERLRQHGLVRADGSKDTKAAAARMVWACQQRGRQPKMTGGGAKKGPQVALDEEACLESGDAILADYASYTSISTMLTKDVEALEVPAQRGMPVQSRFETLLETGRTSCSGGGKGGGSTYSYQLQNPRRKLGIERLEKLDKRIDEKVGIRQCFVPRDGFVFSSNDYGMFEACSWCQASIDIGRPIHRMIQALNANQDVHLRLAARWLGTNYEDVFSRKKSPEIKETRQRCKPGTFGFMGGMGATTFVLYAKNQYGVIFTMEEATKIKNAWYEEWEPRPYFNYITSLVGESNQGEVVHVRSLRRRAWVPYTVASNSYFQGLAADCAKDAGYEIFRECMLGVTRDGRPSPLAGSRIVNFVHDEFICEHPLDIAHEAAFRVAELMMEAGRRWMPDVPPKVVPALMRRWLKTAEERFDENGRLIPYEPSDTRFKDSNRLPPVTA